MEQKKDATDTLPFIKNFIVIDVKYENNLLNCCYILNCIVKYNLIFCICGGKKWKKEYAHCVGLAIK